MSDRQQLTLSTHQLLKLLGFRFIASPTGLMVVSVAKRFGFVANHAVPRNNLYSSQRSTKT